jgi:hypothetical protein
MAGTTKTLQNPSYAIAKLRFRVSTSFPYSDVRLDFEEFPRVLQGIATKGFSASSLSRWCREKPSKADMRKKLFHAMMPLKPEAPDVPRRHLPNAFGASHVEKIEPKMPMDRHSRGSNRESILLYTSWIPAPGRLWRRRRRVNFAGMTE